MYSQRTPSIEARCSRTTGAESLTWLQVSINSLTLLSAEVEGRTYGGGVLELVPSEVSRLAVPLLSTNGELSGLDRLSRSNGGQKDESDALVEATDRVLAARVPGLSEVLGDIVEARLRLRNRRFARA